jgi:hypothetical protein
MTTSGNRTELVMRLAVPTAIMLASLWYLGSLWDARMRAQNLILVRPVVVAMIPFYLWIVVWEIRRHVALPAGQAAAPPATASIRDQVAFMGASVVSVPLFYVFGAVPATAVLLVASLWILRFRKPLVLILVPVLTSLLLWLIFVQVFGIRIPLFLVPW